MDIKNIIAQASAAHMSRVGAAMDELVAAATAARADGFQVSLVRKEDGEGPQAPAAFAEAAAGTLLSGQYAPALSYSVSIRERTEG